MFASFDQYAFSVAYVALAAMALDLEAALGRTEAELQRVDALIAATSRKAGSFGAETFLKKQDA